MITKLGKQILEKKLIDLKVELDRTVDERRKAAQEGDLRENSAYHFLGEQAEVLRVQIGEIEEILRTGKMILKPQKHDKVIHGHLVEVKYEGGKSMKVTIVGKLDSNLRPGWISYESPLAVSLIGKGIGDVVLVNDRNVEIVSIASGDVE